MSDQINLLKIKGIIVKQWVEEVLKNGTNQRDAKWTERIAVGDKEFVMKTKTKLGAKAKRAAESWKIVKDMSLKNLSGRSWKEA